jgi:ATP/maltotriose-dependent transcriptional regulator MalT
VKRRACARLIANLRGALIWSQSQAEDADAELHLASTVAVFWRYRGYAAEACMRLEGALARADRRPTAARAIALHWAGILVAFQGNLARGRALAEQAVAVARELEDGRLLAHALRHLAAVLDAQGERSVAFALFEEALGVATRAGSDRDIAWVLLQEGIIVREQGCGRTSA